MLSVVQYPACLQFLGMIRNVFLTARPSPGPTVRSFRFPSLVFSVLFSVVCWSEQNNNQLELLCFQCFVIGGWVGGNFQQQPEFDFADLNIQKRNN